MQSSQAIRRAPLLALLALTTLALIPTKNGRAKNWQSPVHTDKNWHCGPSQTVILGVDAQACIIVNGSAAQAALVVNNTYDRPVYITSAGIYDAAANRQETQCAAYTLKTGQAVCFTMTTSGNAERKPGATYASGRIFVRSERGYGELKNEDLKSPKAVVP